MALVITRKAGQSVTAGTVLVKVARVKGSVVVLHFDAPKSTKIMRTELVEQDEEPTELEPTE